MQLTALLRRTLSGAVGWLADRRVPTPLRAGVYRTYARATGADLDEVRPPLEAYPSLGAFFVRRLVDGARPFPDDPAQLPSPVDGRVQWCGRVDGESAVQAKGRDYSVRELLGGVGSDIDLDGASAWTLYLSPRDYHRIHAPVASRLREVRWVPGDRRPVRPKTLASVDHVLSTNERAVLYLESERGPYFMVFVGALNVGRIRVVGVRAADQGVLTRPREFARGDEIGRFEMGSTVVLVWPRGGPEPLAELQPGTPLRMGQSIGESRP